MPGKYDGKKIWTATGWSKNKGYVMESARTRSGLYRKIKDVKWLSGSPSIRDRKNRLR